MNRKLGQWVKWQRQCYAKTRNGGASGKNLIQDRVYKLEAIAFPWGKSFPALPAWEESFEELQTYHQAMRHCDINMNTSRPSQLANWVSAQRNEYRRFKKNVDSLLTLARLSC
jgi:Helicase associated domain